MKLTLQIRDGLTVTFKNRVWCCEDETWLVICRKVTASYPVETQPRLFLRSVTRLAARVGATLQCEDVPAAALPARPSPHLRNPKP